ncbi:hypothetical protein CA831_36795, partial [Burkholderia multivorans]
MRGPRAAQRVKSRVLRRESTHEPERPDRCTQHRRRSAPPRSPRCATGGPQRGSLRARRRGRG